MIAAVIVLALIAFTSCLMILFSCHGLHLYGAWLPLQHPADLWLVRVLVSVAYPTMKPQQQQADKITQSAMFIHGSYQYKFEMEVKSVWANGGTSPSTYLLQKASLVVRQTGI